MIHAATGNASHVRLRPTHFPWAADSAAKALDGIRFGHIDNSMKIEEAALVFEALGSETRLAIISTLLAAGQPGAPVGQIQDAHSLKASTLTHHLRRLVAAGLVSQDRRGTTLVCRAQPSRISAAEEFLEHMASAPAPRTKSRATPP